MAELTIDTPVGVLCALEEGSCLVSLSWRRGGMDETPLLAEVRRQLNEYFSGVRKSFDLPLNPHGTKFQRRVWSALQEIPYGETRSYSQIAATVENPKGCRAVGMANNRNPIPIIIPCHRVVGADGALTGYAGGLDKKALLLALEQAHL